jgi:chromosome segregation ATPase
MCGRVLLILIFIYIPFAQASDWSSCADDLDRLRRAARDASDLAQQVELAKQEFESKKRELENCLNYPETYAFMRDRCQSLRWGYESALSRYKSELSNLESELNTIESRIRSVDGPVVINFQLPYPKRNQRGKKRPM